MSKTYVTYGEGHRARKRAFSRAVVVEGERLAFLAGVTNMDQNGDPVTSSSGDAIRAAFDRLSDAVEAAGGKLRDVVTMTVFLTDPRYGDEFVQIRGELFGDGDYPASALITCSSLARKEMIVEIQGIAAIPE